MRKGLIKELKEGLRFSCELCGRCCRGLDEGYVFLYGNKIEEISHFLEIDLDTFLSEYCEIIDAEYRIYSLNPIKPTRKKVYLKSIVLKQDITDGKCVFLKEDNHCQIYGHTPIQCQTWPIWFANMTNSKSYNEAKNKCPGFKDMAQIDVELMNKTEILKIIRDEILLEQDYIKKMRKYGNDLKKVYPFLKDVKQNLSRTTC